MRVATMAIDHYGNYGNNLQKYALQRALKNFVDFTELLWKNPTDFFPETLQLGFMNNPIPRNCDEISRQKYIFREAIRLNKMKEFENRYIKVRFDLPYLEDIADDYDFFIVGSDQVWNPYGLGRDPKYFLNFVPREKRISYAASISVPAIPEELKEFFKRGISGFDYVSVREEKSVEIIKELTGQDALLVLDPVMLLTPKEWLEIAQKPSWFNEKYQRGYILTYYLRNNPPKFIQETAKKLNLPVINLLDWDNYWHYITSPEEFVYLFSKASLIFTNSFHGLVFSILFKRPFMNFESENDPEAIKFTTRIPGLLKMFGLEDRIITSEKNCTTEELFEIDYSTLDKVLPQERRKSFEFLSNALGVKMKEAQTK